MRIDWSAVGGTAGAFSALYIVWRSVVTITERFITGKRKDRSRIDLLEIRLFGLPADPDTGAKKLDGEFDKIDKRFDALPGLIKQAVKEAVE